MQAGPQSAKVPLASLQQPNGGMAGISREAANCIAQTCDDKDYLSASKKMMSKLLGATEKSRLLGEPALRLRDPRFKPTEVEIGRAHV